MSESVIFDYEQAQMLGDLVRLLKERDGQDFDGEVHLTSIEAERIIYVLSSLEGALDTMGKSRFDSIDFWKRSYSAAKDKLDRYEKTLQWYANGGNWWSQGHPQMDQDTIPAHFDRGQRALKALADE